VPLLSVLSWAIHWQHTPCNSAIPASWAYGQRRLAPKLLEPSDTHSCTPTSPINFSKASTEYQQQEVVPLPRLRLLQVFVSFSLTFFGGCLSWRLPVTGVTDRDMKTYGTSVFTREKLTLLVFGVKQEMFILEMALRAVVLISLLPGLYLFPYSGVISRQIVLV